LSEIADEATLRRFQLSLQSLRFDVGIADPNRQFAVKAAILRSRRREGLFAQDQNGVRIIDDTIFDTEVTIPAAAPVGRYEVEVFVFRDGDLEDLSLDRFILARAGLEQFVHDFALGRPTLYGLTALALALTAGWIASLFFRKR
jgi:uncharacterized protein (TIGR02186 family)